MKKINKVKTVALDKYSCECRFNVKGSEIFLQFHKFRKSSMHGHYNYFALGEVERVL